ncbi:MAG TPA: SUMF1/EgtB/PvdO family nonheme iron enzyme [Pyrinomonadaceae bacterium]|nr:SUMF1/EgtB/PvdO family nonheme iron enzyme [Pyrinomonadaceae bacterium]
MTRLPAEQIAARLEEVRAQTLRLFDLVPREADLHESPGFGLRPVLWHLAHVGVFEAYWVLQRAKGDPSPDERYERVFDPIATPREQSKDLPTRVQMEAYLARVRSGVLRYLDNPATPSNGDGHLARDGYVFRLVLEHERQHQETLTYLLQLLDPAKKARPDGADGQKAAGVAEGRDAPAARPEQEMIEVPAGTFTAGAPAEWDAFVYDNERPAHGVSLPAFRIDRLLTTNEDFMRFVSEGGYERREWWGAEGWQWRCKEDWSHPLYWRHERGAGWRERLMFEDVELRPDHPVVGVSWYEAEAYANFMGKRLPGEAEWERAAAWDSELNRKRLFAWGDGEPSDALCNFGMRRWGTTRAGSFPEGASAAGLLDATGNVWEWTADPFAGYAGFEAYPYPEYSEAWFDGDHRVLKGGSWATSAPLLRTSFRNFFRRQFRIAPTGIRLVETA